LHEQIQLLSLLLQADLMPPPYDGLNSLEVGMTSMGVVMSPPVCKFAEW
jgi:hypothetical protein